MQKLRIRFRKTGRAKYISHLDLNRFMSRALRRAEIPVWMTQGFNPHPYITFALPLSLFYESLCEVMDSKLDGEMSYEEIAERLNRQMPEGIEIYEVCEPVLKVTELAYASYQIRMEFPGLEKQELEEAVGRLQNSDKILVTKTTKRHEIEIDLKEIFTQAKISAGTGSLLIEATVPASPQENLNPSCLLAAIEKYAGLTPEIEYITRTGIYNNGMEIFR